MRAEAVKLISISEDGNEFKLNEDNLDLIVNAFKKVETKNSRLAIVSVVGAFRTGKSFLLSSFLRYLTYCEANGTDKPDEKVWLTDGSPYLSGGNPDIDQDAEEGAFTWKSGKERMTEGIWVYSKPFVRTLPSGERVSIMLMDTQGMFDMKTGKELTAAIFGLSTLLSSLEVYNIVKQIQEDKLEQLHYFTEFSRAALKEFNRAEEKKKDLTGSTTESEEKHSAFQSLQFLIRDWQNFEDEEDIEGCLASMPAVLEDSLNAEVEDEGTREQIKAAFDDISCFLLPHPGKALTNKKYDGKIEDIDKDFLGLLDVYVRNVFEKDLVAKEINGRKVSIQDFSLYIKAYAHVFREGKLPKTMTLVQAISVTTNLCAKDDAVVLYKNLMREHMSTGNYVPEPELTEQHNDCKLKTFQWFDKTATFGEQSQIDKTRNTLNTVMEQEFSYCKDINKNRMHAGLEKYIIPLLAAAVAFLLDWISDYTCDAWSDTCVKFSRNFALFYYLVTLVIMYELYRVYRDGGAANLWIACMTLGKTTMEKAQEYSDKAQKLVQEAINPSKKKKE